MYGGDANRRGDVTGRRVSRHESNLKRVSSAVPELASAVHKRASLRVFFCSFYGRIKRKSKKVKSTGSILLRQRLRRTRRLLWGRMYNCFFKLFYKIITTVSGRSIPVVRLLWGSFLLSGCSIPVVRLLWEQIDRVRFSAPRQ